jgi:hypothetical protein
VHRQQSQEAKSKSAATDKKSMLMLAARGGHAEMVQLLLEHNADVMHRDENDQSALKITQDRLAGTRHDLEAKIRANSEAARRALM